jgi:hypothetical protein
VLSIVTDGCSLCVPRQALLRYAVTRERYAVQCNTIVAVGTRSFFGAHGNLSSAVLSVVPNNAGLFREVTVMSEINTSTSVPVAVLKFQNAYERLLPEILQVPDEDLVATNIDIYCAFTTARGSLERIVAQRAAIASEFRSFKLEQFDKLEDYAYAMAHAHSLWEMASKPVESLPALAETAVPLRNGLYDDALPLANHGLIDGAKLKELPGTVGYRNLGFDLLDLSNLLRAAWPVIAGKTPIQMSELEHAHQLADRILSAVGEREQATANVAEASKIRQQAFTLLVKAYDQARRAITYIRWEEDDVDEIAPSLYAARQSGKRKRSPEAVKTAAPAAAAESVTAPAPTANAANAIPVGHPGSNPFTQG